MPVHCRQILYQLSYKGSPRLGEVGLNIIRETAGGQGLMESPFSQQMAEKESWLALGLMHRLGPLPEDRSSAL